MSRLLGTAIALGCLGLLVIACFGSTLVDDHQFAYRDAGHYYYPLYLRVQQEWDAGRLPLWEPEENGGMPLLGNPTAAVLYPGKLIYAVLPYPWAARVYIISHVLLAAGTMFALMRHWRVSRAGSAIAGLSYAFGAPILFQYCNVIFLVGAAWTPLGLRGADRWLRQGRRWGIWELAIVLAMQTLGGDPQSAYVTGLCAGGYAVGLARARAWGPLRPRWWWLPASLGLAAAWISLTLLAAVVYPRIDLDARPFALTIQQLNDLAPGIIVPPGQKPPLGPSVGKLLSYQAWRLVPLVLWGAVGVIVLAPRRGEARPWLWWGMLFGLAAAIVAAALVGRFTAALGLGGLLALLLILPRQAERRGELRYSLFGLLGAAVVATALMAMQLFPSLEYTRMTTRAAMQGAHAIFPFSLEPIRLLELAWPEVFGSSLSNRQWLSLVPPQHEVRFWIPSLYLGGLPLVLALGSLLFWRGRPPWVGWLTGIALGALILSLGQFASPLWHARTLPGAVEVLGPLDPNGFGELRRDGQLPDGFGSPYWTLATFVPGFRSFRYPSKFLTFACLGLAGLAGAGWDRALAGRWRRVAGLAAVLALVGLASGLLTVVGGEQIRAYWQGRLDAGARVGSTFGPFDPIGALLETRSALWHGSLAAGVALVVVALAARRPRLAGGLALVALSVDLALANSSLVRTVPQELFEGTPLALDVIQRAEAESGSTEPYRIHRMPAWEPTIFPETASEDRVRDFTAWERKTIQPKYAIPFGTQYTLTIGVSELYDYMFFFAPFESNHDDEYGSRYGLKPGERLIYFPRRGFDLWNSKYFVLPRIPSNEESRGYLSFKPNTERIYPPPDEVAEVNQDDDARRWDREEDWQVVRNLNAYPRAWIVHRVRRVDPITGLNRDDRQRLMEEISYQADALWNSENRVVYDPRAMAWVEAVDSAAIAPYPTPGDPDPTETVRITRYEPTRVELEARLHRAGIVVLADVLYPGWKLTVDGQPAPILRVNRLMRGAALPAGTHTLVYTYEPRSVAVGATTSTFGFVALAMLGIWSWRQGHRRSDADPEGTPA